MRTRIGRSRGSRSDRQGRNLQFASTRARHHMLAMTRIAITAAAFDAIAATLALYERESGAKGEVHIWLEPHSRQPTAAPARTRRKLLRRHPGRRISLAFPTRRSPHASSAASQIPFPPHSLQRKRRPTSGTMIVPARASTFTSATCPQASHLAITACTPF
jgi:hypothetical protein